MTNSSDAKNDPQTVGAVESSPKLRDRIKAARQGDEKVIFRAKVGQYDPHRQPYHDAAGFIAPIAVASISCIVVTCGVALWKVVVGNDTAFFAYTLAGTCVLVCGVVLASFFGKSGRAGPIQTK